MTKINNSVDNSIKNTGGGNLSIGGSVQIQSNLNVTQQVQSDSQAPVTYEMLRELIQELKADIIKHSDLGAGDRKDAQDACAAAVEASDPANPEKSRLARALDWLRQIFEGSNAALSFGKTVAEITGLLPLLP